MAEDKRQEADTLETSNNSLQDFNWDNAGDFFNINPKGEEAENVTEVIKKEDDTDDTNIADNVDDDTPEGEDTSKGKKKKESDDEEQNVEGFFEDEKPNSTEEGEEGKGAKPGENDDKFYTTLASELKEKGIFQNVEIKEGEEIDEDKFFELQDSEIESRVEETFEAFFEELDDDGKAFLKHKKAGGSTQDFMQVYQNTISIDGVNLEEDKDQDLVLAHYMRTVDTMDEDEITDRIEWLKENGKKKAFAEKYFNKLKDIDTERKTALAERASQMSKQREESAKKFNEDLDKELNSTESVGSFSFGKVDKKGLMNFITKPTVKVGKNKYITEFQAELGEIFKGEGENKKKLLLLAKLVKSQFDVKDLIEETKTKVVKDAKSKLQQSRTGVRPSTSGGNNKKSLSDFNF